MKYELSYDRERDLIIGRIEGNIDPAIVKAMASEFAELVSSSGCSKLLNDLRNAAITHSALDIYSMPRIVDKLGLPIACRRALLVSDASKDFQFLETVSLNVGQQVRIFKDPESAIKWLEGCMTPPNKPDSD